jgi:TM2 domain-containing membrane protein YozV
LNGKPPLAGFLSLLIPGLGQISAGQGNRGAAILAAAIVIGNLNLIFLLVFAAADRDPGVVWAYWNPRLGHDVMSLWSIAFWLWAMVDAVRTASDQEPRGMVYIVPGAVDADCA